MGLIIVLALVVAWGVWALHLSIATRTRRERCAHIWVKREYRGEYDEPGTTYWKCDRCLSGKSIRPDGIEESYSL